MLTPKDERAYPIPTALLEGSGDFPQGSACEGSAPAGDSAMAAGPRGRGASMRSARGAPATPDACHGQAWRGDSLWRSARR
jgi:hypothetical protein